MRINFSKALGVGENFVLDTGLQVKEGSMIIQLIIIGNEILDGKIADQNLPWLSSFLLSQNLNIKQSICVRDQVDEMVATLQKAFAEADVIITSGGLGPTPDDLTKLALSKFLQKPILHDEKSYQLAVYHYERRGIPVPTREHTYAQIPQDFRPVPNPCGLAPGLSYLQMEGTPKLLLSAPGVPREFQEMVKKEFLPIIKMHFPPPAQLQKKINIRTKTLPEEKIFTKLDPQLWKNLAEWGQVSSLPHTLGVDIGVHMMASTKEELQKKKERVLSIVKNSPVEKYIWHVGEESLSQLIVRLSQKLNITFCFAESCTGGHLSSLITDIPGSSQVFRGGVVSYQTLIKENLLGVSSETLTKYGVVSKETALEMAQKTRSLMKTHLAISTTGLAGPGGGSEVTPLGTIAIGICSDLGESSYLFHFQGDRKKLKDIFTQQALHLLLQEIQQRDKGQSSLWNPL